jgi:protein phosphatase
MKYLIIGDVHGVYAPFKRAVDYASENDLHLISVGDLIDNGPEGYKIVSDMNDLVKDSKASMVWGNHEWKIHRWILGNPVQLGPPNLVTTDEMETNQDFIEVFVELMQTAQDFIRLGDSIYITHAGMNPDYWNRLTDVLTKLDKKFMKFGNTDPTQGEYPYRGQVYPVREYSWTKEIPQGVTLYVGHDPRPMVGIPDFDNFQDSPETIKSDKGGKTVFLDCGAGKGGSLYGAVVNKDTPSKVNLIDFGNE